MNWLKNSIFFILFISFTEFFGNDSTSEGIRLTIEYGLSARQGDRKTMEDAHAVCIGKEYQFFSLFDGHYGDFAACYAAEVLPTIFFQHREVHSEVKRALRDSFFIVNNEIIKLNGQSGTTALVALYEANEKKVYIASVGDSRAVIARNGEIVFATKDHNIKTIEEYQRLKKTDCVVFHSDDWDCITQILKSGGTILTPRFLWQIDAISESTRSLGDGRFNDYVIAEPDMEMHEVCAGDIIILACDGVWDVIDNETAVFLVTNSLKISSQEIDSCYPVNPIVERGMRKGMYDTVCELADERIALAARVLRDEAYRQGSTDNISVMVLVF